MTPRFSFHFRSGASKTVDHNSTAYLLAVVSLLLSGVVHGARTWSDDRAANIGQQDHHTAMERRFEARYPVLYKSSWNTMLNATDLSSGVPFFKELWRGKEYAPNLLKDGSPYILEMAGTGRSAALCLCEKAGSTRWKQLIHKSITGDLIPGSQLHGREVDWLPGTFEGWEEKILDPKRMRFMLVRNPYSKVLSGFLDKCVHNAHSDIKCPPPDNYTQTQESFSQFVKRLHKDYKTNTWVNPHFTPLTDHCGLSDGFKFHFYLKSEETHAWYPEFISFLRVAHAASSGWALKDGDQDCFYELPGKTCHETHLAIKHHGPAEVGAVKHNIGNHEMVPIYRAGAAPAHASGADLHLQEFYTEESAKLVTDMFRRDLEEFGYDALEINNS